MERETLSRLCALMGLLGALFFAGMWVAAVVTDGNWILGEETLSELGGDRPGALFFNTGVIVMGVMGLFFTLGLHFTLRKGAMVRAGVVAMGTGAITLVGVGLFPITTGAYHTFFSYAFFGLMLVTMILLTLPLWTREGLGNVPGTITILSVIISLGFLLATSIPLAEAVAVICLLVWTVLISSLILIMPFRKVTGTQV